MSCGGARLQRYPCRWPSGTAIRASNAPRNRVKTVSSTTKRRMPDDEPSPGRGRGSDAGKLAVGFHESRRSVQGHSRRRQHRHRGSGKQRGGTDASPHSPHDAGTVSPSSRLRLRRSHLHLWRGETTAPAPAPRRRSNSFPHATHGQQRCAETEGKGALTRRARRRVVASASCTGSGRSCPSRCGAIQTPAPPVTPAKPAAESRPACASTTMTEDAALPSRFDAGSAGWPWRDRCRLPSSASGDGCVPAVRHRRQPLHQVA